MYLKIFIPQFRGRLILVCLFIIAGIAPNAYSQDFDGITNLMCSARDGEEKAFGSAVKKVDDINARDAWGWAALTYAVVRGNESMTKRLLARQANANVLDDEGRSPLMYAVYYDHDSLVKILLSYGADPNVRDYQGMTIIGLAWVKAKDGIVELLEKAGAAPVRLEDKRADIYPLFMGRMTGIRRTNFETFLDPRGVILLAKEGKTLRLRLLVSPDGTVRKVRVLTGLTNGLTNQALEFAYRLQFEYDSGTVPEHDIWTPFEQSFTTYLTRPSSSN